MELGIAGKRVIVTGGSRGIGRAIAWALAEEGCAVGLIARGAAGLEEAARALRGLRAHVEFEAADVTGADFEAAIARLREKLGGVELAVANAGGSAPGGALDTTDAVYRAQWELNFLSAVRLLRACEDGLEAFLSVSSISGLEAFGRPSYVAAKAALHGFAKSAAKELAPRGIRVNCLAPGSILFPGGSWDARLRSDPEGIGRFIAEQPFGRLGTPEEVANLAAFLLSPRASWISGSIVVIDGAQSHSF